MPHFRDRPNYVLPPSRTRRRGQNRRNMRRFPGVTPFGDDAPTALDVLMALPPQSRRAILDAGRL